MPPADPRPLLAFDFDGVLARPPLGLNLTIQRDLHERPPSPPGRPSPAARPTLWDHFLIATYYRLRHRGRRPVPGAGAALRAARRQHRVVLLSGRSWRARPATEAWLRRHGLAPHLDAVILNDSGLPAAEFKRRAAAQHGLVRLVDDDARTAALLARDGLTVDLIDWPRNRGLDFPPGVTRWRDLPALTAALTAALAATPPPAQR